MFIHRAETDTCSSSGISCSSSPSNASPPDSDSTSGFDPSLMERPGARRYIGIGMVAGLLLIVLLVWLFRGKWPRRVLHPYCCCSRRSEQPQNSIVDDREDCLTPSEKDRSTQENGLVKEISGGMVVFTQKIPKALAARDRYPAEWDMEHVHGIRLEMRTPQRHHARNGSRQS